MRRHNYNDLAFSLYDFLNLEECVQLIKQAEEIGFDVALVNDGNEQSKRTDVRNNQRIIFDDPDLAMKFWVKFSAKEKIILDDWEPIGFNERFRFYKYDQYQTFKWHRDMPYKRSENIQSQYTFMIYLNSDFSGGFTDFEDFKIWPETGMAAIFYHKLRHEGSVVSDGTKYVLRTDIMFQRK